jgi:hypothetical protein
MFSVRQKREIAEAVQRILRATTHPELPQGEIHFALHVQGAEPWSWADIRNNGAALNPGVNPHNEAQDVRTATDPCPTCDGTGLMCLNTWGHEHDDGCRCPDCAKGGGK